MEQTRNTRVTKGITLTNTTDGQLLAVFELTPGMRLSEVLVELRSIPAVATSYMQGTLGLFLHEVRPESYAAAIVGQPVIPAHDIMFGIENTYSSAEIQQAIQYHKGRYFADLVADGSWRFLALTIICPSGVVGASHLGYCSLCVQPDPSANV